MASGKNHAATKGQKNLPFEEAQGCHDERRSRIGLTLMRVDADLYMREFVMWVFNTTHGGLPGHWLYKSYTELAESPWGLCCSYSKARSTVYRAEDLGIVVGAEQRNDRSGSQKPNGYQIDWAGIERLLGFANRRARVTAGVLSEQPPVSTEQPPVSTEQHTKEIQPVFNPSFKAGQGGLAAKEVSTAAGASADRWTASARACVREAFAAVGLKRGDCFVVEVETTLGKSAAEVVAICDEYRANRSLFAGPGAITYRLREGSWPVEGVKPAAMLHALATKDRESEMEAIFAQQVKACRARGVIDEEAIKLHLREYLPDAFLQKMGWFSARATVAAEVASR